MLIEVTCIAIVLAQAVATYMKYRDYKRMTRQ